MNRSEKLIRRFCFATAMTGLAAHGTAAAFRSGRRAIRISATMKPWQLAPTITSTDFIRW